MGRKGGGEGNDRLWMLLLLLTPSLVGDEGRRCWLLFCHLSFAMSRLSVSAVHVGHPSKQLGGATPIMVITLRRRAEHNTSGAALTA